MDRTMYGKIDPGARQPYRTVRSKGIQPGCKYSQQAKLIRLTYKMKGHLALGIVHLKCAARQPELDAVLHASDVVRLAGGPAQELGIPAVGL